LFPFWWDVEYDRVALTETCDGEEDYGIFKDSMKCTFEITNDELDSPLAVLSNVDCDINMWQGDSLFDSFEQLIDE
jgi:hypothetical protein